MACARSRLPITPSLRLAIVLLLLSGPAVRAQIAQVRIEGHTDDRGSYQYNLELSLQRANSVASFVFSREFGRFPYTPELQVLLSATGRSFMEPQASNDTELGRAQNRRVEFKFRLKDWDMMQPVHERVGIQRAGQ